MIDVPQGARDGKCLEGCWAELDLMREWWHCDPK
jgi:hypothetical protein